MQAKRSAINRDDSFFINPESRTTMQYSTLTVPVSESPTPAHSRDKRLRFFDNSDMDICVYYLQKHFHCQRG